MSVGTHAYLRNYDIIKSRDTYDTYNIYGNSTQQGNYGSGLKLLYKSYAHLTYNKIDAAVKKMLQKLAASHSVITCGCNDFSNIRFKIVEGTLLW